MAGRVKLRWNMPGFRALRTSPKMLQNLQKRAERIADKAGPGFVVAPVGVTGGRGRGRAAVVAAARNANRKNAKDHTLVKNLDAGSDSGI